MTVVFNRVAPDCRDLARTIETLLADQRHKRVQHPPPSVQRRHAPWRPKDWTRDELCDVVYSSYKALLKGAIRRPPRRHVIMDIADYLECSLYDRNRLLVAAGYAPEHPDLDGDALAVALTAAHNVIEALPWPAHVLTRAWDIDLLNIRMLHLLNTTRDAMQRIPVDHRNILQFVFDSTLPLWPLLRPNAGAWERVARREIAGFKHQNQLFQYEAWYRERIDHLMQLPHFPDYWNDLPQAVQTGSDSGTPWLPYTLELTYPDGTARSIQPLLIGLSDLEYPKVIAYMPVETADHR